MIIGFYFGWIFLVLAFASAAAEVLVLSMPHDSALLVSAHDLWFAIRPGSLVIFQIHVERLSPFLWDPVFRALLAPPAWLTFGGIGIAMAWWFWPGRHISESQKEDILKREEALFLYDELSREAVENGFLPGEDDMLPDHAGHHVMNSDSGEDIHTNDQLEAQIEHIRNPPKTD